MLINVLLIAVLLNQMCLLLNGSELGETCAANEDCSIENSHCYSGKCSCLPYYASYNYTVCLQSTLLGFECHVPEQCSQKVANSSCIQGTCQCEQGFLQFRRHTCLTPAKVGQICYSDTHCRLWDSDTHCHFLIQNLFGKCVCNSPLGSMQNGACVPSPSPVETTESTEIAVSTEITTSGKSQLSSPSPTSFINRSPIKFSSVSPSQKPHKKPQSPTQRPNPQKFKVSTPKPSVKPTENPNKVLQEKISTELEPPFSSQSTLKPFKTTITFVEKTKPGIKPNKPNKHTATFLSPSAITPNFPKFTIDVTSTTEIPGKLTTWIINDNNGALTRIKPTTNELTKTTTTASYNTVNCLRCPTNSLSNGLTNGLTNSLTNTFSGGLTNGLTNNFVHRLKFPARPTQYTTIKLNSTADKTGLPAQYGAPGPSLTTRWTTPAPARTTPRPLKHTTAARLPGTTVVTPSDSQMLGQYLSLVKLKNQSKPSFGVMLVKPTHETPTTSTWIRPVTPGSSNTITKIIASPGPAVLYNVGTKTGPEKDPLKVSLGMVCKHHKQCIRADPESRCINGICDCVKPRNNETGAYCNAFNRGCHPNTFQCKSSGKCISWFFVCDGRRDCADGSDEACGGPGRGGSSNGCPTLGFRCGKLEPAVCVSQAARCDGAWDCPGGEDEQNCTVGPQQDCPRHTYRCKSGQCVPEYEYCNAAAACKDGSDELAQACSATWDSDVTTLGFCPFRCNNGRCRSSAVTCSGKDGCGDESDEAKCNVCRCAKIS
nr:PREDICTED: uncharacterized protein LOC109041034 [Bemisia tabaci]